MDLTATAIPNSADLFSLSPLIGNAPAASTDSSASSAQDFSALLTELTGPGNIETADPSAKASQKKAPTTGAADCRTGSVVIGVAFIPVAATTAFTTSAPAQDKQGN